MKGFIGKGLISGLVVMMWLSVTGQNYYSRSAKISFYSDAPLEKIEAHNSSASSILDLASGQIEFAILIKGFQFKKALMQQHFNESYLESDKFPKAVFRGSFDPAQFNEEVGECTLDVSGELTIKGISKPVDVEGKLLYKDNALKGTASFEIAIADFGIKIPKVVRSNIAETVLITVEVPYEVFEPN